MTRLKITLEDVRKAHAELNRYLLPTPLIRNSWLSETLGCELYLKLENMQPIGSFKIRGASYKISTLTPEQRAHGVIAASAGNHAQGVAWGSCRYGVHAVIVMPKGAPLMKIHNTKMLGAEVVLEGDTYDEAFAFACEEAKRTGRVMIHAFEDPAVIAGQGTAAIEILDQLPDVDFIVGSIGGGGLMAGIATVTERLKPGTKLIGCQASGAPSMIRAIRDGKSERLKSVDTFADGIKVARASEPMVELLKAPHLSQLLEADDEEIAAAVLTLLEKAKVLSEGAGALPLAALSQIQDQIAGKKVVVVISGGNIDVNVLSRIIDRGLIRAGRRVRVNVLLSDRPGSLARLTDLIAKQGANILQAIHDRNEPSTKIDQTDVALTLETRGPEHSAALIQALREHVLRVDVVS